MRTSVRALCLAVFALAACRSTVIPVIADDASSGDAPRPADAPVTADAPVAVDAPVDTGTVTPALPAPRYTGGFTRTSGTFTLTINGTARTARVHVPPTLAAGAPLVLGFHGTNGSADDFAAESRMDGASDELGFVAVTLQGEDLQGNPANADHRSPDEYARMWNIVDRDPTTNRDLVFVRAVIAESQRALGTDPLRTYAMGHSNGGFFAWHVAATLAPQIAGFASSCAGVIRCGYRSECTFRGAGTTCAALATEPGWCAQTCAPSTSRMALAPAGRVPRAFLAHGNRDDIVSVAFTCALGRELGDRATVQIVDGLDHALAPNFVRNAWSALSRFTTRD